MSTNVILHGMHRSPNFGDVLLTQILRDHLVAMPDVDLKLLAPTDNVQQVLGNERASWGDFLKADAVILGGGGFFQRMDGPKGSLKTLIKYALPLFIAKLLGKRTAIIGAGAAPMPRKWLDRMLALLVGRSDIIAVRDQTAFDYFAALLPRPRHDRLQRVSDLVFAVDRHWIPVEDQAWANQTCKGLGTAKVLAVHLSEAPSANGTYRKIADTLREFAITSPDCGFLLLEDHPSKDGGQAEAQAELIDYLAGLPVRSLPYPGVEKLAAVLGAVDAVLTTKLHVGLCAATMGTMPFAVAKHRKNLASFADIGTPDNCCMLGEADAGRVEAITTAFLTHQGAIQVPNEVRERSHEALELATQIVASCK